MKKRIIVLVLVLAMCFSLTACGGILGAVLNKAGVKTPSAENVIENILGGEESDKKKPAAADEGELPAAEEDDVPVATAPTEAPDVEVSTDLEDYLYGTWLRETMYLEHYECDADMYTTFNRDGTGYQVLLNHDTGEVLYEGGGEWWFEDGDVLLRKDGDTGNIRFVYDEKSLTLKNGNRYYTKLY